MEKNLKKYELKKYFITLYLIPFLPSFSQDMYSLSNMKIRVILHKLLHLIVSSLAK